MIERSTASVLLTSWSSTGVTFWGVTFHIGTIFYANSECIWIGKTKLLKWNVYSMTLQMHRYSLETAIILLRNTSSRISPKWLSCDVSNCCILIILNPLFVLSLLHKYIYIHTTILHVAYSIQSPDLFSVSWHYIIILWSGASVYTEGTRIGFVDAAHFEIKGKRLAPNVARRKAV